MPNTLLPSIPGAIPLFEEEIRAALGAPSERELTVGDISDAVDRGIIEFSNWQPRTQAITLLIQPNKTIYDSSDFDPSDTMIVAILSSSLRAAPMVGGLVGSDPSTPTDAYISLYATEAANDADEQFLEMNGGQVAVIGNVAPGTTVSAYAYVAWKRANFPLKHLEDLRLIARAYAGQRLLALRSKFTQVNFGVSAFSLNNTTLQSLVREWEENFRARVSRVPFAPL